METFISEIDILKDLKSAIERYSSNGRDILLNINSTIHSKLDELKSEESYFTSKVQDAEDNLRNAESALSDCESQSSDDDDEDGGGGAPDCSSYESEVSDCQKQLNEAQEKLETYKQEIQKLENEIDSFQNTKLRFQSSLDYQADVTPTRLLSSINKLEAYVSYSLLPSFSSNNVSSTSSDNNVNYVYKEFKDKNETYSHWIQFANPWQDNLTSSEFQSLTEYKNWQYGNINAFLRGDLDSDISSDANEVARIKTQVSNIDSAINKSVIPENVIAYRAFDSRGTDFRNVKLYSPRQFVSTALNKSGADFFLNQHQSFGRNPVMAKIFISKGKHGAYMDGIKRMIEDGNEILLPKNSRFKVLSCETINGIQNIELKLL